MIAEEMEYDKFYFLFNLLDLLNFENISSKGGETDHTTVLIQVNHTTVWMVVNHTTVF